ncbi:1,4-alpha-glucan branching enzyme [Caminicella sporogenes DSM 14501]|uniref:1,4-alpha-glucan branching enzyme GlgB n=2 Tax=Caminicella TaxID=166484 RepID=A0A1M6SW62_9FIRM|nr:1,4-alpha-glucan branching protein GlgB [Caminicella sporogenes]RKD21920.1 1,4-alpha-glucan branching enzyme [Caminicella sporogenes]SHK48982.1 1,4-alpha-glucan branching enzyme [Caminicella sporogenes DSM 14501]
MVEDRFIGYICPSSFDIYLFHQGNSFRSYKFLGAHITEYRGIRGVSFTVWAPNAKEVRVVGDFNNWNGIGYSMNKVEENGIWNIFISGIGEGHLYKYEIHTNDGRVILKSDPYAFYSEKRPNTASIVTSLKNYVWNDEMWMKNKEELYDKPVNIYEMHLGSWKTKGHENFYTYSEIVEDVIRYVKEMGYTHIELLPLTEYPFDGSWGYQATGYFSITSRYGRPEDFMYFVDRCHQEGIGVILDWVPGHFCKDSHGLYRFDGTAVYEHADSIIAENKEWGTATFDYGKPEVVSFLISSAVFWFDVYHIDGLRVDAVSYMLYLDHGKKENDWKPNRYGGRENLEAIEFIKKLNKTIFEYYPKALMIAEESTAWPQVTSPVHLGGLGFNFKWNMGWMNDMLRYMKTDPIYRKYHHDLITFSFVYAFSENYILPLSHDEVVHGKKSLIEKMPGDYWQKFANLRLFYSYMIAHPGKKLLFMGGEFGHFIEWDYKKELDWFLLKYPMHEKFKHYVKRLNNFYKNERALYVQDSSHEGFSWIDHQNDKESIIAFIRKAERDFVIAVFNFTPIIRIEYKIGVPYKGEYEEVFNSDLEEFGGSGVENRGIIRADDNSWHNQPYSIKINLPPLGAVFLKLRR